MDADAIRLFALQASHAFGEAISQRLGIPLSAHEERAFTDGEHKTRALVNVRGRDAYVVQALYGEPQESPNDKLCKLLFFIGALKDAGAERVTAVVPYLCYARKDRKTKARDPVTLRYVASLFEAVGTDGIMAMDVHNLPAFQNAFRCATEHLEARTLFAAYMAEAVPDDAVVVVSPDAGGEKRAELFRQALGRRLGTDVPLALMEKQRSRDIVSGHLMAGDVAGRVALILDDLVSTGATLARAAEACLERGATRVYAIVTHGLFVGDAGAVLAQRALEKVVVTNTVPPFRLAPELVREKLAVLDATGLFAEAIRRQHTRGSIVDLLEHGLDGTIPEIERL